MMIEMKRRKERTRSLMGQPQLLQRPDGALALIHCREVEEELDSLQKLCRLSVIELRELGPEDFPGAAEWSRCVHQITPCATSAV